MRVRKTQIRASYIAVGVVVVLGLLLGAAGWCWFLWQMAERFQ